MSSIEGEKAFDEAVSMVQQQIATYKERTSKKLQKLEATIEIARQKMQEILSIKTQRFDEGHVNPLSWQSKKKSYYIKPSYEETETLQHLNLRFPKYEEGSAVFETIDIIGNETEEWPILIEEEIFEWKEELPGLQEEKGRFRDTSQVALETYIGEPIYDDEPEEGHECWPGKEFILAALRGENSNLPDLLQSELCTSEGLEANLKNKPNKVLKDGDNPKLVDYKGEKRQGAIEEKSSIILTNRREELIEDVPCEDSPTAANSYGLEKKSSHLNKKNMIIFDPGGLVQEDHSEGINMMFKNMISIEEVKLEKVALINSACGQPGQWQGHPKFVVQIEISDGIQGRQGNPGRVLRFEDHEASRKRNTITIFDPGGYPSCLYEANFAIRLDVSSERSTMRTWLFLKGEGLSGIVLNQ